jgi:hypothetical protein
MVKVVQHQIHLKQQKQEDQEEANYFFLLHTKVPILINWNFFLVIIFKFYEIYFLNNLNLIDSKLFYIIGGVRLQNWNSLVSRDKLFNRV